MRDPHPDTPPVAEAPAGTMDGAAAATEASRLDRLAEASLWRELRRRVERLDQGALAHGSILVRYAESLLLTGEPGTARALLDARLPSLLRGGNRAAIRRALNLAGAAAFEAGDLDHAADCFERAWDASGTDNDALQMARAANNLALVAAVRGLRDQALAWYMIALPCYQRCGDLRGVAETYHNMAITHREGGQWRLAEEAERQALDYAMRAGNQRLNAFVEVGLAEVQLHRGDPRFACLAAYRAVHAFAALGEPAFEADALRVAALCHDRLGETHDATETLRRALRLCSHAGNAHVEADCRAALGGMLQRTRDTRDEGELLLASALAAFEVMGASTKAASVRALLTRHPGNPG